MSVDGSGEGLESSLYHVESSDPESLLIDRSHLEPEDIAQINRLMAALGRLRQAEDRLSVASTRYMKLNRTDMRALHYLIVSENRGEAVTPGMIASHLEISSASTTKLLDRLARGGHIVREPHPTDRRALIVHITRQTRDAAMETVGKSHAKRFTAAANLSRDEREVVIGFLEDMTQLMSFTEDPWPAT